LKDVSLEEEILHESLVFNMAVALVSLLVCGLLLLVDLVKMDE
jgi:hypothetical protein